MKPFIVRAGVAALCALTLSACVNSASPILTNSQPLFGERARFQLYGMRKGIAVEPERVLFAWDGARYAHAGGGMKDVRAFSVHLFEAGNYIIQSVPKKGRGITEYAVMRKLTEGVYQVIVIDEADADESTRTAHCGKSEKKTWSCRIETREQLFAFARATAARHKDDGGLAIRLPDKPEQPAKRRP